MGDMSCELVCDSKSFVSTTLCFQHLTDNLSFLSLLSGLHGYTHEYPSKHSASEQQTILDRSIEVLTNFNHGKRPEGYTAPAWSTSRELIPQLRTAGILYDHSFMHHDVQPYWAPDSSESWIETNASQPASTWMKPMGALKPSRVVEIPANWHLDDWPPLQSAMGTPGSHGFVDTSVVEKLWREQWDFAYRQYESFVFPISVHPQVSGKPHVVLMHESEFLFSLSFWMLEGMLW